MFPPTAAARHSRDSVLPGRLDERLQFVTRDSCGVRCMCVLCTLSLAQLGCRGRNSPAHVREFDDQ